MLINLALFILIFILFYLVIFCYGIQLKIFLFSNANLSVGEIGILGFTVTYILATVIHFFSNISLEISLSIFVLAFFIFIKNFFLIKKILIIEKKPIFFLFCISIILSITTNLHDDVYLYQLPTINYLQQSKIIFGIQGFSDLLAYGHGFYNIMALFQLPVLKNTAVFLLPVIFLNYFLLICYYFFKKKNNTLLKLFISIIFLVICFRYTRTKEFGADIAPLSIIFLLQIYILDFLETKNLDNLFKFLIFFIFGIFLKIYVISTIFLIFVFIFILKKKIFSIISNKVFFLSTLIIIVGSSNNLIHSGCLFYPASITCFDKDFVSWSVGKEVVKLREAKQSAEAKALKAYIRLAKFSENKDNYIQNIDPKRYLEEFKYSYLKYIILDPDLQRLLVPFFIIVLIFIFSIFSKKEKKYLTIKNILILNIINFCCVASWLIIGPQSRYGGIAFVSFFLFTILFSNGCNSINLLNKKILNFLFLVGIFFILGKNSLRIYKEVSDNDFILIKRFPFSDFKEIDFSTKTEDLFTLNISHSLGCGNVKFPCTPEKYAGSIIEAKNKYGYFFVKSNDKILLKAIEFEHFMLNHYLNNR